MTFNNYLSPYLIDNEHLKDSKMLLKMLKYQTLNLKANKIN